MCHDNVFHKDEYGGYFISEHVGVGSCCQPLPSHGDDVQTAWQLVEETWMTLKKLCNLLTQGVNWVYTINSVDYNVYKYTKCPIWKHKYSTKTIYHTAFYRKNSITILFQHRLKNNGDTRGILKCNVFKNTQFKIIKKISKKMK